MKKYLLGSFMMIMGFAANAQNNSAAQKFSLGPQAGVGSTWIDNFGNDKQGKLHGNFGVSMIYSAIDNFGIGLDVKYSLEGGKTQSTASLLGNTFTATEEVNLNYLRLPLKAMFFFGKYGNSVRPKIAVGPSFGFLLGGKTTSETKNASGAIVSESSVNSADHFKSFDFGLHGAAGINYRLVDRTWLVAEVAYNHGLSDIAKENTHTEKLHNRNFAVNLGVNFGL